MSLSDRRNYVICLFMKEMYNIINDYWNSDKCLICENFRDTVTVNLLKYSKIYMKFEYNDTNYVNVNFEIKQNDVYVIYNYRILHGGGGSDNISIKKFANHIIHDAPYYHLYENEDCKDRIYKYSLGGGLRLLMDQYIRR